MTTPSSVDHAIQVTNEWLREMSEMDQDFTDRDRAYASLQAVLHVLRDRLTMEEAVHLGAQLPLVVRGAYYGSWNPHHQPTDIDDPDRFYQAIRTQMRNNPTIDAERATKTVFALLKNHVTQGEIDQVIHMLPKPLQQLWH